MTRGGAWGEDLGRRPGRTTQDASLSICAGQRALAGRQPACSQSPPLPCAFTTPLVGGQRPRCAFPTPTPSPTPTPTPERGEEEGGESRGRGLGG